MNLKIYKQEGFVATLCAAIILLAIPVVTDIYKESFVPATGHFKIMGGFSIILVIGLLGKWKLIRDLAGILIGIILFGVIFMAFGLGADYAIAYCLLIVTLIGLLVLLNSKSVKAYMNS